MKGEQGPPLFYKLFNGILKMSVQSTTETMGIQRMGFDFSSPLAEALLRSEDQIHASMDKTRSTFERMKGKAEEAQAAKDKEIAALQKALDLAKTKLKAQETSFQEKETVLIEKNKTLTEENSSLKNQVSQCENFRSQIKEAFSDLRKDPFYNTACWPARIQWFKSGQPFPYRLRGIEGHCRFYIKAEELGL